MRGQLYGVSGLLGGMGIVLVGSGLLGTLLPVRANLEGFSDLEIGVVMSANYVGFIVGTVWCGRIIRRVGHIRGFATFAALATVSILAHTQFVSPIAWTLLRALVGASLIGVYIAVESWLNERAERSNRGSILAVYEMVGLGALAAGQFLLTVGDIRSTVPFMLAAGLFALGLIPVALTRLPEPVLGAPSRLSLGALVRISPVAVVGTLAGSAVGGAFFSLGPLYAQRVGLGEAGIAAYMSAGLLGGAILQWPIGGLSDHVDRRLVIGATALAGAGASALMLALPGTGLPVLLAASFLFGGTTLVLYALCVAHANDLLPQAQFLDAARGFNFLYGVGAAVSPVVIGALMSAFGPASLYWVCGLVLAALALVALARAMARRERAAGVREEFVAVVTPSAEALEMHPHKRLEGETGADAAGS
jgi:MFS family permease